MSCPSCQLATINGVLCHEMGCPDSHLFTARECDWCGAAFEPESQFQRFCDDSCACSFYGLDFDS
jgi:hypothetical protein